MFYACIWNKIVIKEKVVIYALQPQSFVVAFISWYEHNLI